jgi:uncharacterized membrane protein YkvA (DUF1232 family)
VLAIAIGLVVTWLAFLAVVFVVSRRSGPRRIEPRMFPDTLRLVRRLVSDRTIPWSARLPVWLLLAYLVLPIDLVPDFFPVIGYADDAILTALVLRHVMHRSGPDKLVEHWPGSAEGLATLRRALRLPTAD